MNRVKHELKECVELNDDRFHRVKAVACKRSRFTRFVMNAMKAPEEGYAMKCPMSDKKIEVVKSCHEQDTEAKVGKPVFLNFKINPSFS